MGRLYPVGQEQIMAAEVSVEVGVDSDGLLGCCFVGLDLALAVEALSKANKLLFLPMFCVICSVTP